MLSVHGDTQRSTLQVAVWNDGSHWSVGRQEFDECMAGLSSVMSAEGMTSGLPRNPTAPRTFALHCFALCVCESVKPNFSHEHFSQTIRAPVISNW